MMTRKRWIAVGATLAVLCLVCGGLGVAYLARTIPGVARLFRGAPAATATMPAVVGGASVVLPTTTLTATPTRAATEVLSSPISTPSATAAAGSTDLSHPAASLTVTPTATGTVTPTLTPASATPPQWIAFESKRGENGDYEIVAVKPDGSRQTNLTNSWADDVAPVWAPGGRRIAFVSFRDTVSGKWGLDNGSIYVMTFDPDSGKSGEVWRVTDDGGSEGWPTWSPDGKRIAFQSDRSGNWDLWVVNADGTGLAQLTHHGKDDRYADWSPDGTKIAFTSSRTGDEDVWVLDVEDALESSGGGGAINLTRSPSRDRYPFWSPDGKQLTFNTKRDGDLEVYIMNADGSRPYNVSQSPKSTEGLADWSPDGKQLVFYSDRSGNKEVYILDLASRAWTNISNDPASDEFCTWSR